MYAAFRLAVLSIPDVVMALISDLQTVVPAALISYCFPLPIVTSLWISFGQWLTAKRRTGAMVYIFSVFTYAIARMTPLPFGQAAILGGIIAPACYGLLFISFGVARMLRTPYGSYWQRNYMTRSNQLKRWVEGAVGACVGGITGATLGVLLGYFLIILLYSAMFLVAHSFQVQANLQIVDLTVYGVGFLGSTLGLLTGLRLINWQRCSERFLISLIIYFSFVATTIKRLLKTS